MGLFSVAPRKDFYKPQFNAEAENKRKGQIQVSTLLFQLPALATLLQGLETALVLEASKPGDPALPLGRALCQMG